MAEIKQAKPSPRIEEDGSIRWYEGDSFELEFAVDLTDSEGNPITINENDVIEICFQNKDGRTVAEFEATGTDVLRIDFNKNISTRFGVGEYTYCLRYNGEYTTTLARKNRVVVE